MIRLIKRWLHRLIFDPVAYKRSLERYHSMHRDLLRLNHEQIEIVAYDRGFRAGHTDGLAKGFAEGEPLGREVGYTKLMESYGLLEAPVPAEWRIPERAVNWGPHANIYEAGESWVLRFLTNAHERIVISIDFSHHKKVDGFPARQMALFRIMEQRMRAITAAGLSHSDRWIGPSPLYRFPDLSPAIGRQPLDFDIPSWQLRALDQLGLHDRYVQDLLLITAADLAECEGIGPKRLAEFRELLAKHDLALWDDPPPGRKARTRAICLD